MTSFNGPWSRDLDAFKKSMVSMPDKFKSSFTNTSTSTMEKICDPDVLHVWESDSDIDNLLQLTSVIAKLCDLGMRKEKGANAQDGSMLIIAEEKKGRNNFARLCQLVEYLTCADGKKHLDGTVCVYSKIVIVRGWDNSILPNGGGNREASEKVVKRINVAIERVFKMGNFDRGKRRTVWHHGPIVHFLLHWINNTTSTLRSTLSAITITGSLDLTNGVAPSIIGRANKLQDLERLEQYTKKMDIPAVFLDCPSQMISFEYLGTYMYFFAYYINTLLPLPLSRLHLHKAQDELITFAFRLRAASEGRFGIEVVKMVQKHLDAGRARQWARSCVSKDSYEKGKCRAAGRDEAIHHAVQIADSPFALLNHKNGMPAFARLAVGPAARGSMECFVAAPVQIKFKQAQLRPSKTVTTRVLIPAQMQDLEKVTNRIQGLMMAVLERVRQEKGNPQLSDTERATWKAVVKACLWAIDGCTGKMPKGVDDKVKFVKQKLKEGTWGFALGATANAGTVDVTATAMPEPNRSYGFGQGARAQQIMGSYGYGGQQGGMVQQMPFQSMQTGVDPSTYAQAQGQGYGPSLGIEKQQQSRGYAYGSLLGGEYRQNMGRPW